MGLMARHERFYFKDGNIILKAEDTLYNIHRHFLREHSEFFNSMLTLPQPGGKEVDGASDEHPISMDDLKVVDLDCVFSIFYPKDLLNGDLDSKDQWLSVLNFATKWQSPSLRDLAIVKIQPLVTAAERIALSRAHGIDDWFYPAMVELCKRDIPLTHEEGRILGVEDVVTIAAARQRIRHPQLRSMHEEWILGEIRAVMA